jgi:hypothetical protein
MFFDVFKALCDKKGVSPKRATEEIGLSNSITTKWKKQVRRQREKPFLKLLTTSA